MVAAGFPHALRLFEEAFPVSGGLAADFGGAVSDLDSNAGAFVPSGDGFNGGADQVVHRDHLGDQSIIQPILEMAAEVGADGFCREQTAMIGRPDSRPLLVDIKVPTLVLVGRQDIATPLVRAEEMAADIGHSQLVVIEKCGHMAPLEKPAEVSAALRRWLTQ